jgi:hypothetical protein
MINCGFVARYTQWGMYVYRWVIEVYGEVKRPSVVLN